MKPQRQPQRYAKPQRAATPKAIFIIPLLMVLVFVSLVFFMMRPDDKKNDSGTKDRTVAPADTFDKTQFSLSDPTSPWLVVNKQRPLDPKGYTPEDLTAPDMELSSVKTSTSMQLRTEAAEKLAGLAHNAKAAGHDLVVVSGFRNYDTQKMTYESEVRGFGQAQADRESARPGYSEHQTGWAVDLGLLEDSSCNIKACFGDKPAGKWLAANAHTYGFIIRYPKDKTTVTGYDYEPWHLRYVGQKLAHEMHDKNIKTLEEFFGLAAAPNY